jgi:hypothetical protein
MNRSPRRRNPIREESNCSGYEGDDECNGNINCYFDYDEKECKRKRSPTSFRHSPYYNISPNLDMNSMKNIHSFLYTDIGTQRLVDLYPHNPNEILYRIQHYHQNDNYTDEVIELLNYLPNDMNPFHVAVFNILNERYCTEKLENLTKTMNPLHYNTYYYYVQRDCKKKLLEIIGESGNIIFLHLFERHHKLDPDDMKTIMRKAINYHHIDMLERMVELDERNFNWIMAHASQNGHRITNVLKKHQ